MFWIVVFLSLIIGLVVATYIFKKNMIVTYRMDGSFDDVEGALKEVVPGFAGWTFPIPDWQFYKSQVSKGLTYKNIKNMVMHFVCKPVHANRVLQVDPSLGAIMPCTWAVYETIEGEVYIAKMNIALMSKIYFGVIGEVMRDVARTEEMMLERIRSILKNKKKGNFSTHDYEVARGGV